MATLIDDNDADGQLGKLIWWLLSIRCTRNADYAFSAVGVPNYFDFSDFQDFCELVVDIGINRDENGKLCGDVNNAGFESSLNDTYVTPVPGGVGLLTRLALMQNTLNAYKIQKTKG